MAALLLTGSIWLTGCVPSWSSQQQSSKWSTGFWFWSGGAVETETSPGIIDVLFVHAGYIRGSETRSPRSGERQWYAYGTLPRELPAAREYWLVWRYQPQGVPDLEATSPIAEEFARLAADARERRLSVAGLQLDIDSPTAALPKYAQFLEALKKSLPQGCQISITALLDWFRSGTAIEDVIRQVDEFVPQFYDVQGRDEYDGGAVIAARVDADRWGLRFRRFGKPFRIGISTFGRARMLAREDGSRGRYFGMALFRDLAPMDVANSSAFEMQASRNQADELVLSYRAVGPAEIGYSSFKPGDTIGFILATSESVRAAVESARQMGDGVAGVVFFRWPTPNEGLTMRPEEALRAAGLRPQARVQNRIDVIDGRCIEVECVDLYLQSATPLSPRAIKYIVRASTELEYFIPERNVPASMAGPSRLEVRVPPYCGRSRLYLGRAVSLNRAEFSVQEER